MGQLIIQLGREVAAKGRDKLSIPDENKLREQVFAQDYELIKSLLPISLTTKAPLLLYPGSGPDILLPLLFVERLFPEITMLCLQLIDLFPQQALVKTILDDIGIPFSDEKGKITFYWRGILVKVDCIVGNVFAIEFPPFDIYFERAFRIMKDQDPEFEKRVFAKLKPGGVLISDSGFANVPLKKIQVPKELSAYGEMVVGVK